MRAGVLAAVLVGGVSASSFGAPPAKRPPPPAVRVEVQAMKDRAGVLDTKSALKLAPEKSNPRLAQYRVEPRIEIAAVKGKESKEGWGIASVKLQAIGKIWVRAAGGEAQTRFTACVDGLASKEAAAWAAWVESANALLVESLKGLHGFTEDDVLKQARLAIVEHALAAEHSWRMKGVEDDNRAKPCGSPPSGPGIAKDNGERSAAAAEGEERSWTDIRPLARVPLKRWNRQVTARVQLWQGGKALNGQFLVDLQAPHTIASPVWLDGQGLPADWVKVAARGETRVRTGGALDPGTEGPWIRIEGADLSGLRIPVTEFQVAETDLYGQPDAAGDCCDGVLGSDLLKRYVVETRLDGMQELVLYDAEKYRFPADWGSAELIWEEGKGWVSDCETERSTAHWAAWDWAGQSLLALPALSGKAGLLDLRCGGQLFGTFPRAGKAAQAYLGFQAIDGRRLVWDFPQNRLRFPPQAHVYRDPAPPKNLTGLAVSYGFKGPARIVTIQAIAKGSLAARAMSKLGAAKGDAIVRFGGRGAEKLSSWEIQDLLGGRGPQELEIEWRSAKGVVKTAKLAFP